MRLRCEPINSMGEGRLLPVLVCSRCEGTYDVSPTIDPWGGLCGYQCGDCDSGQEGPSWHDAMEAKYPLLTGTERY